MPKLTAASAARKVTRIDLSTSGSRSVSQNEVGVVEKIVMASGATRKIRSAPLARLKKTSRAERRFTVSPRDD
jgi:hypothetical protein